MEIKLAFLAGVIGFTITLTLAFIGKLSFFRRPGQKVSYTSKVEKALGNLKRASTDIDNILLEFNTLANERKDAINAMENELLQLTAKENELTSKIQALEKIPIAAAKYFEEAIQKQERKVAKRDYVLFSLGAVTTVIVTIIVTVVLKKMGM